jgi:hypothetical protein
MKKLILVALMATIGATAQDVTVNGTLRAGAGGSNMALKANGYAEVTQNLYVGGYVFTNNIVGTAGAVQFNGAIVSGVRAGVTGNDAVNMNQLNTIKASIDNKLSTKADKVQVAQDIQQARGEAIRISNEYTDEKIKEVNHKLDLEIEANKIAQKKLDDKINSNDEKINQRVRDLEIKVDNRFNAVMSYVSNEFTAVNNRLEGLGASMVALSAAATSSVYNPNKPTNLNIATGVYGKGYAIAGGLSHFFNSQTKVSVNWSQGSNTKNAVGVGVGFSF